MNSLGGSVWNRSADATMMQPVASTNGMNVPVHRSKIVSPRNGLSQPRDSKAYGSRNVMLIPTAAAPAASMTSRCSLTIRSLQ